MSKLRTCTVRKARKIELIVFAELLEVARPLRLAEKG